MVEINLDGYDKVRSSGVGGNAAVYKLYNQTEGHVRALRETKLGDGETASFEEHCRMLLRLGNGCHPHIIRTYGFDVQDGLGRVLMDYVHGESLTDRFKENKAPYSYNEVLRLLLEIGSALAYCHHGIYKYCYDKETDNLKDDPNDGRKAFIDEEIEKRLVEKYRVVHNDLHTGNIMCREDGGFVLLDFDRAVGFETKSDVGQFNAGAPEFVAPEKLNDVQGYRPQPQADVYGFGVILYQALTGRPPYVLHKNVQLDDAIMMLRKEQEQEAPPSVQQLRKNAFEQASSGAAYTDDCPQWLEAMVMKCLEKEPSKRYCDCKELYEEVLVHLRKEKESAVLPVVNDALEKTALNMDDDSGKTAVTLEAGEDAENMRQQLSDAQKLLEGSSAQVEALKKENAALKKGKGGKKVFLWKFLTVLFLLAALGMGGLYLFEKLGFGAKDGGKQAENGDVKALTEKNDSLISANKSLAQEIAELQDSDESVLRARLNQKSGELEKLKSKYAELEQEYETALAESQEGGRENNHSAGSDDKTVQQLEKNITELKKSDVEKDERIANLVKLNSQLSSSGSKATPESEKVIKELKKRYNEVKKENEALETEISKKDNRIKQLEESIRKLKSQEKSTNVNKSKSKEKTLHISTKKNR